jgi:hypothetical protein
MLHNGHDVMIYDRTPKSVVIEPNAICEVSRDKVSTVTEFEGSLRT